MSKQDKDATSLKLKQPKLPLTAYCMCGPGKKPYLKDALSSVDFCEQKIFLSDKSDYCEMAEKMGWEVFHWLGRNSMCERRNYAVGWRGDDEITPDWTTHPEMSKKVPVYNHKYIIQIDDDEVFDSPFYDHVKHFLEQDVGEVAAISIDLRNMHVDGGDKNESMSSTPLPRMFTVGNIHWEKDIQNDVCYEGETGYMPVIMYHYGYGSLYSHWEKQWSRMKMNEDECRAKPFDLNARGYLVNCLAVVGGDVLNQPRLLGHVAESIEQFNKKRKSDIVAKITIERTIRHLWSTCANSNNYAVFVSVLSRVEGAIDWIVDVPYWKIVCAFRSEAVDWELLDKCGREYLKAMHNHLRPPIMNIEVQSLGEEVDVCQGIYDALINILSNINSLQMKMSPEEFVSSRKAVAKSAQWWRRQIDFQIFLKFLRDNGINPDNDVVPYSRWKKHTGAIHGNRIEQIDALAEFREFK